MSVLSPVAVTDSFDQWRQKDNDAITELNNLASSEGMFKIVTGPNQGDTFVYNATDGFFENQGISALVNDILISLGVLNVTTAKSYYFASLRNVF